MGEDSFLARISSRRTFSTLRIASRTTDLGWTRRSSEISVFERSSSTLGILRRSCWRRESDIGFSPRQNGLHDLEKVHSKESSRPFQFFFATHRGHAVSFQRESSLERTSPFDVLFVETGEGDNSVNLLHHLHGHLDALFDRLGRLGINETEVHL